LLQKACLQSGADNVDVVRRILQCFSSWVSIKAITLNDVVEDMVVGQAFQLLGNVQVIIRHCARFLEKNSLQSYL